MPTGTKVNGVDHSFATIESSINNISFENCSEINYETELDIGKRRNKYGKVSGTTTGDVDESGDFTLPVEDGEELLASLGDGYGEVFFNMTVSRADGVGPILKDELTNCRIVGVSNADSQGNEASSTKFSLFITEIFRNGKRIVKRGGIGPQ